MDAQVQAPGHMVAQGRTVTPGHTGAPGIARKSVVRVAVRGLGERVDGVRAKAMVVVGGWEQAARTVPAEWARSGAEEAQWDR